nr:olfactory receptor 867-like [Chrysemys picta bellii]
MEEQNLTAPVTEFVLLGLTQNPELQRFLFVVFLIVYVNTWLGIFIIITVIINHRLHTPMYFLNLVFLDVGAHDTPPVVRHISGIMKHDQLPAVSAAPEETSGLDTSATYRACIRNASLEHHFTLAAIEAQEMDLLEPMRGENGTLVTKFILLGLSSNLQEQLILFGVFTAIYLVAPMNNVLILPLLSLDSRLHSLMYFLLGNLSVVDIGYISSTMLKMLANYLLQDKFISWAFCLTQIFFISFGGIKCLLLGVMAYDRYVVICHPLHYGTFMLGPRQCQQGFMVLSVHAPHVPILNFTPQGVVIP